MVNNKSIFQNLNKKLIFSVVVSVILGLVVLRSASLTLPAHKSIMKQQYLATALGIAVMIGVTVIDYRIWKKHYKWIYIVSVVLLLLTLIAGDKAKGATSWITIPIIGFRFQPSEFTKIGMIISFAAYLEKYGHRINDPKVLVRVIVLTLIPIGLIFIQPDLGTALVYFFFIAFMIFYAGLSWKIIGIAFLIVLLLMPVVWLNLGIHQKNRILDFLDSSYEGNYQFFQGMIAIGSGKLTGKGLTKGSQTQFGFIPERHNDFIYPSLVEELGFIGGILVIIMYGIMITSIFRQTLKSSDKFGSHICVGIGAMMLFHIFENIGMTLGVMPITGIPLPFYSAGGTFQLINLSLMGLVLSVSIRSK